MSGNSYRAPDARIDVVSSGRNGGLLGAMWFGELALWKAIVFVQLLGWGAVVMVSTLSDAILPYYGCIAFKLTVLPVYAGFSSVCVYRTASRIEGETRIYAAIWISIFMIYAFKVTHFSVSSYIDFNTSM